MSDGRDEPGTPEQAPRRERRARGVAEGTVTVSVVSQSRDHVADLQVPAAVIAGPVREHLLHEMVKSQLASRRAGTAADQDARLRQRRRQEALEAEGHRPRPRRQHAARRSGRGGAMIFRPAAARLLVPAAALGAAGRAALRARGAARRGQAASWSTRSRSPEPKTKRMVECLAGLGVEGSVLVILGARDDAVAARRRATCRA